jgi:hypothetical protein
MIIITDENCDEVKKRLVKTYFNRTQKTTMVENITDQQIINFVKTYVKFYRVRESKYFKILNPKAKICKVEKECEIIIGNSFTDVSNKQDHIISRLEMEMKTGFVKL